MIDFFLSHPAVTSLTAFVYMALIWLLIEIYGGPRHD